MNGLILTHWEGNGPTNFCQLFIHFCIFDPLRMKISTLPPYGTRIEQIEHGKAHIHLLYNYYFSVFILGSFLFLVLAHTF